MSGHAASLTQLAVVSRSFRALEACRSASLRVKTNQPRRGERSSTQCKGNSMQASYTALAE
jgi:hypothetical protein